MAKYLCHETWRDQVCTDLEAQSSLFSFIGMEGIMHATGREK